MQNYKEGNTWNVHVILARDIHSFDQVSKNDSIFAWNPQDRFIVLIVRSNDHNRLNESDMRIDDVLKSLWSKRKMQSVFISEMLVSDTSRINRVIRTYNPFAKINDSEWGKIEIVNVKTAKQASNILSHLTYYRTKNLNGYELKVGLFERSQSIKEITKDQPNIASYYSDIFKGFDETVLNTITEYMNFKVKPIYSMNTFGYQLSNGTYVGAIGDIVHGRTDICFVTFFVKKYNVNTSEDVEFSTYVEFDRVCVIVPKAPKVPKWLRIYHFFPLSVWVCLMLSHILTYLMWYFLQVFALERSICEVDKYVMFAFRTERTSFLTMVYRSFLLNAGCPQKLPNTNAERILLTGILLANVTLVGIFSGILYNSFAHDMYYPDIDSLRDLDASELPILLSSFSLTDLFDSSDLKSTACMQNLRKKLRYGLNAVYNAAYSRNVSGFIRELHYPIIRDELIDADGGRLLHLVKECPGEYYLSYLLPKNSILHERINTLIGRLNQAGLPSFWNRRIIQAFVTQKRLNKQNELVQNEKETNGFVPFNLSDVQSSFYMLLIGLLISTIVFLHEKGWLKASLLRTGKSSYKSTC
ncbi:hypothetical protein DMN91_011411 [Ooceraea biroi]|uniref:Ionotropic glutamate receptor C-terminal domain-containing protein n=1 Tax=Ooceraea biroi TaxID=2015173 RepID=A0A026W490_OOCBI|nr:hypothetical protein X777_10892 [Ooceraea biroi]RLU15657.1 hypothetical protein DMN91_011411 [Ooceraea biroi]